MKAKIIFLVAGLLIVSGALLQTPAHENNNLNTVMAMPMPTPTSVKGGQEHGP